MTILVSSQLVGVSPLPGTWESPMTGYVSTSPGLTGSQGTISSHALSTFTIQALGLTTVEGTPYFLMMLDTGAPQTAFTSLQVIASGVGGIFTNTYIALNATYYPVGSTIIPGQNAPYPMWLWTDNNFDFSPSASAITTINPSYAALTTPTAPTGHGDITDPEAWQDSSGNIPPLQFSQVPYNVNYPLNGDGRYWFQANAYAPNISQPITFIGNPSYVSTGNVNLQWSVVGTANDGSGLILAYSTTTGTWTTVTMLPQTQLAGIQNGQVPISLFNATQLQVQVYAQGGTALSTASLSQVAVAITRNYTEGVTWDGFVNPFDPINYNALAIDNNIPTDTMSDLQSRILVRLGFANQASNPPPGMAALVQDFLMSAQTFLYKRYMQLHTKRFFRWKINPGQRFYSLKDNDENVLEGVTMDPNKTIEWCGIQDSRNVWYPMIQGIPPQLYTMITKPWRPARYELRGAIEIYPVPDQTYWLWVRAHFGLMSFVNPSDTTTIDSELVFLWALANAKAHYGQPDAQNIAGQANAYKAELIAASHQTAHYLPGTIAVPPAVRPTLIQFDANSGGGS